MAATYKNARVQGTASTSTYATLYTVPATKAAVISTIGISNETSSIIDYRLAIVDSDVDPSSGDFIVYDSNVSANDTTFITVGVTLTAGQYLKISCSNSSSTFMCFISEIS